MENHSDWSEPLRKPSYVQGVSKAVGLSLQAHREFLEVYQLLGNNINFIKFENKKPLTTTKLLHEVSGPEPTDISTAEPSKKANARTESIETRRYQMLQNLGLAAQ
jgi:hypothetical protein